MEKVFIGSGIVNQINYNFGYVDFSAEEKFKLIDLSNDIIINVPSSYITNKLGNLQNNKWENDNIQFSLSDIKHLIQKESDIFSLGNLSSLNSEYESAIKTNFNNTYNETLFNEESWLQQFNSQFQKINFLNLINNAEEGYFTLTNINSLFQLWRNSSSNTILNYDVSKGFSNGQFIYFPNSVFISFDTNLIDQKKNTNIGGIQLNKYYNLAFKII